MHKDLKSKKNSSTLHQTRTTRTMNPQQHHFNVYTLLVQSTNLLTLNQKSILPFILLSLSFSSLLFLFNSLFISPLLMDLFLNLYAIKSTSSDGLDHTPFQSTLNKDIKLISLTQCLFIAISFFTHAFITIALVYATSLAHLGRHVTLVDLFTRVRRSWRGPMATLLYVSSLDLGFKLVFLALFGVSLYIFYDHMVLVAMLIILGLLALFFYIDFTMIWSLSSVVSIVEEGWHGIEAITRGKELIRVKRRQGIETTLILVLANGVVFVLYALALQVPLLSSLSQLVNGLVMANASVLVNVFGVVAYVLIYYECKKSCGEEELAMKGKFVYDDDCVPLSTSHETELT